MICLEELFEMKKECEKEKIFVEAKISVIDEMIAKEEQKKVEETETVNEVI